MRYRSLFIICSLSIIFACVGFASDLSPGIMEINNNWGDPGFNVISESASGLEMIYSVPNVHFSETMVNGETFINVSLPGALLGNNEGAPNLPGVSRFIAFPQGAFFTVEILESRSRVFSGVNILPAPPIPREGDTTPPTYEKDMSIYGVDAYYPAEQVMTSDPMLLRGVDAFVLGVTPFAYNPVRKELEVFTDFRLRITFQGGNGVYGEDRLRSRWFEPLLEQHLLNYSELSPVDFDSRPRARGEECEYMIFYPDDTEFELAAKTIQYYRANQGISSNIFNIQDLGGTASAIEAKINDAYSNWSTPPVALLMLGDLPLMPVNTWSSYCLSDNIYADVDGDGLPEMNIARITARDAADLNQLIGKFISYEENPPVDPTFYDEPLIAGGWQSDRWFILCADVIWGFFVSEEGKSPKREYSGYTHGSAPSSWSTNQNTYMITDYFGPGGLGYIPSTPSHLTDWDANATSINSRINSGAFWLLHRDHGFETGWGDPDYDINDLNGLYNEDHAFVLSINCLTGKYDHSPQCFAEAFHRMPYGALGLIAASEISYSFVNDTFVWGMHDSMWPNFDPGYGGSTGNNRLLPGFAQMSGKWYLAASSWPYNQSDKDVTYHLFHTHTDAFTQLCDQIPQDLTVSHEDNINSQATTFEVTADAGSFIGLAIDGVVLGTAKSDGGPVTIDIDPPGHPGIMYVTVTKHNHRRYEGAVIVQTGGPLDIWLPDGVPNDCLPGPTTDVSVMVFDGTETYVSGTGLVHYRFDSADPFDSAPMTELKSHLLEATIPGAAPMSQPEFYFSAQGDLGSTAYNPPDAPAVTYTMEVDGIPEIIMIDDFETDLGWTVHNDSIETGAWERAIPAGNGGSRGDPPTDSDGSGRCYITGNAYDEDVDGGPTVLVSSNIDLSSGDAEISFDKWYSNDDGDDPFIISISNDGGMNWTEVNTQTGGGGGWNPFAFNVTDYVAPSDLTRVSLSAQDQPNDSVTEGGIDNFVISRILYDATMWASAYSFSASEGCNISFYLDAGPAFAGRRYVVAGGLSGSFPGTELPGGLVIPINRDSVTDLILDNLNSPTFENFMGDLDEDGRAVATLFLPGSKVFSAGQGVGLGRTPYVGETGTFAFTVTGTWDFVSNPVYIEVD
jgi:hypothetical protein